MAERMADFFEALMNDRVSEVKLVLTGVVVALAAYQLVLIAVGYGKVKVPFLSARAASFSHRAMGDVIVPVAAFVGLACIGYFGLEEASEEAGLHAALGVLLFAVVALKISIVRWWHSASRWLPLLGISVFVLFVLTAITSLGGESHGG